MYIIQHIKIYTFIFVFLNIAGCTTAIQQEKELLQNSISDQENGAESISAHMFFRKIDQESIGNAIGDILNKKRNTLILKSTGGNVESAMAFYDIIKNALNRHITVIGVGQVSSSAIILFCSGEKRLLGKNSYMLLHSITTTYNNKPTKKQIKEGDAEREILEILYSKIVSDTTNGILSPKQVSNMMKEGKILTAQEAVKLGIATGLLDEPIFY